MLGRIIGGHEPLSPLESKLHTALHFVKSRCTIGSSNKYEDIVRTGGYSRALLYRMDKVTYRQKAQLPFYKQDRKVKYDPISGQLIAPQAQWHAAEYGWGTCLIPLNPNHHPMTDPEFDLSDEQHLLLKTAIRTLAFKAGNCGALSKVVCKWLWEHPEGIEKIEFISCDDFDHAFVIVNRRGDIDKPDSWGDAWIIDPWVEEGIIYPASRFREIFSKVIEFASNQLNKMANIGDYIDEFLDPDYVSHALSVHATIHPRKDRYPSYGMPALHPVEDYYLVNAELPKDMAVKRKHFTPHYQSLHQSRFSDCLADIRHIGDSRYGSFEEDGKRRSHRIKRHKGCY